METDATQSLTFGTTAFLVVLGIVALVGGLYLFVKALRREKRCTEVADGTITALVNEDFGAKRKKPSRAQKKEEDEKVVAANEAIAAKKRAYNAKKREQARAEANASTATWRATVTYAVDGKTYEQRATRDVPQKRYKLGQPCKVHYDPNKPGYCWLQIDGLPKTFGVILMACGVGLMLLGLVFWYALPAIAQMSGAM